MEEKLKVVFWIDEQKLVKRVTPAEIQTLGQISLLLKRLLKGKVQSNISYGAIVRYALPTSKDVKFLLVTDEDVADMLKDHKDSKTIELHVRLVKANSIEDFDENQHFQSAKYWSSKAADGGDSSGKETEGEEDSEPEEVKKSEITLAEAEEIYAHHVANLHQAAEDPISNLDKTPEQVDEMLKEVDKLASATLVLLNKSIDEQNKVQQELEAEYMEFEYLHVNLNANFDDALEMEVPKVTEAVGEEPVQELNEQQQEDAEEIIREEVESLHVNLNGTFADATDKEVPKVNESVASKNVASEPVASETVHEFPTQQEDEAEERIRLEVEDGYVGDDGSDEDDEEFIVTEEASDDGMSSYETDEDIENLHIRDSEGSEDGSDDETSQRMLSQNSMKVQKDMHRDGEGEIKLSVGDVFESILILRATLRDLAIQDQFELVRVKNEKTRVSVKCKAAGCEWKVRARVLEDEKTFQIKELVAEHNCLKIQNDKEATSRWMSKKIADILRVNPEVTNSYLKEQMESYGLQPSYMKIWRARVIAMEMLHGKWSESYTKLPHYAEMVKLYNPGSYVEVMLKEAVIPEEPVGEKAEGSTSNPPKLPVEPFIFQRIFMGLNAAKKGFLSGCQPFIGFDGTFLKTPYGGILLAAISLDVNNGIFPIAVAVVEQENQETWGWFFNMMENFLEGFNTDKPWTFMSDRQKGLVESAEQLFPNVVQRKCARHIFANFRKLHKGPATVRYFWMAARAYNEYDFNYAMWMLKEKKPEAYEYLHEIPASQWSRHAYPKKLKNEHITNNFVESFNNWIGALRDKPILTLLEGIRTKMMNRMQRRYEKSARMEQRISPHVVEKLNVIMDEAGQCDIRGAIGTVFEIGDKVEGVHYVVDLVERKCDCGMWELSGIPCKHSVKAIRNLRGNVEDFVDESWYVDKYKKAYSYEIKPVKHHRFWPPQTTEPKSCGPPEVKRQPGRPKKLRNRESDESAPKKRTKNNFKCYKCGCFGHNQRTCERRQKAKEKKDKAEAKYKRVGQKRKNAEEKEAMKENVAARKKARSEAAAAKKNAKAEVAAAKKKAKADGASTSRTPAAKRSAKTENAAAKKKSKTVGVSTSRTPVARCTRSSQRNMASQATPNSSQARRAAKGKEKVKET